MEPQIGQIVLCAFPSQLAGFLVCNGSEQSISDYVTLSAILGEQTDTFVLPNIALPSPLPASTASWQICAYGISPPYGQNSALVGEIDLFAAGPATFGPSDYLPCDGSIMYIEMDSVLFSIIGNDFGGDSATLCLPKLPAPQGSNLPSGFAYGICNGGVYPPGPALASIIGTLQLLPAIPAGSEATWPLSYVACNGQALSIGDYPALYSVIGTAFGSGAGTFNVPSISAPANMMWTIVANGVVPSFQNEAT